jgi:hypothetical protein
MRDRFQAMLGSALSPFSVREDPQIQNAMRCGVTIVDYAPHADVATDLHTLEEWMEELLPRPMILKGMTA